MTDVAVMEKCCYCGRSLALDKLIYNESKGVYFCADSDECNSAQGQAGTSTYTDASGNYHRTAHQKFNFHYRQSSCGSALMAFLVGVSVFFVSWGYAVKSYGWLLGLGLGWIPAFFLAIMAGMFWPVAILIILGLLIFSR